MRRILLTTLITSVVAIVLTGLYVATVEKSFDSVAYFMVLGYGNIIIPTLLIVIIFSGLTRITKLKSFWAKMTLDIVVLGLTVQLGIWVWAAAEVVLYYGDFSNLTFHEIQRDYDSQFSGWTPVALILTVSIPLTYGLLKRRQKEKHLLTKAIGNGG